jgi:hypothetical protein
VDSPVVLAEKVRRYFFSGSTEMASGVMTVGFWIARGSKTSNKGVAWSRPPGARRTRNKTIGVRRFIVIF